MKVFSFSHNDAPFSFLVLDPMKAYARVKELFPDTWPPANEELPILTTLAHPVTPIDDKMSALVDFLEEKTPLRFLAWEELEVV